MRRTAVLALVPVLALGLQGCADRTAPVTDAVVTTHDGWSVVTVTSAESDVRIEVRVDDGGWLAYDGPIRVDGPGYHSVGHRGIDAAGNAEHRRAVPVIVSAPPSPPSGPNPTGIGNPFAEHNGLMWEYIRAPEGFDGFDYRVTPFATITAKLREGWYSDRGIHHLGIYGPWRSTRGFLGLPPLDFFDAQVDAGSLDDFAELTEQARQRGITVTMYLELIYLDPSNPVFVQAAHDIERGVDSWESRLFRWDAREQPQARCPADDGLPPALTWTSDPSIAGGRCYVQAWGELGGTLPIGYPALDYAGPEAMGYAKRVIAFWMDLGVQGFVFDAPHTYFGMQGDDEWRQHELQIDTPTSHVYPDGTTRPVHLEAEGEGGTIANARYSDRVGYTSLYADVGDDATTLPLRVAAGVISVDALDRHSATWVDTRRQAGRSSTGGVAFTTDVAVVPPELRALDAAVQAGGAGMILPMHEQTLRARLDERSQDLFFDVLRVIGRSPALAPGASRVRIPTDDPMVYAVLRTSMDGSRAAIGVFNFSAEPASTRIAVAGTGPLRDLADDSAVVVTDGHASIDLPGYGYRFFEAPLPPSAPWETVDAAEAGWSTGGGWSKVPDPSALGGTRIAGNETGGFAEYRFTGTRLQGWGWTSPRGGDRIQVSIDGEVVTLYRQRGEPPVPGTGGDAFHGQLLFALDGLGEGEHMVRLEQLNGPGGRNADGTGIEYLRVAP